MGQDLSCTAANPENLMEKALEPHTIKDFLQWQHDVFNRTGSFRSFSALQHPIILEQS